VDGKLSCWFLVSCRWIGGDERKQGDDARNPWLSTEFVRNGREWARKHSRKSSHTAREGRNETKRKGREGKKEEELRKVRLPHGGGERAKEVGLPTTRRRDTRRWLAHSLAFLVRSKLKNRWQSDCRLLVRSLCATTHGARGGRIFLW
jgi:hypothetical protein